MRWAQPDHHLVKLRVNQEARRLEVHLKRDRDKTHRRCMPCALASVCGHLIIAVCGHQAGRLELLPRVFWSQRVVLRDQDRLALGLDLGHGAVAAIVVALARVACRIALAVLIVEIEASFRRDVLSSGECLVQRLAGWRAVEAEHAHAVLRTRLTAVVTIGAEVAHAASCPGGRVRPPVFADPNASSTLVALVVAEAWRR